MRVRWRHVKLAIPVAIANLIPVAGVIFLGWKILALFMLFWLETVAMVIIGAVHHLFTPVDRGQPKSERVQEAFGMLLPNFFFAAGQLWLIMGTVGMREMQRMDLSGDMFRDFGTLFVSLDLLLPTATLLLFHAIQEGRHWRSRERSLGMLLLTMARFFALSFLLIPFSGAIIVYDVQMAVLIVLVVVKAGVDYATQALLNGR
jgi:hypothetical protein